jgi:hypothetical protein
MARTNRRRVLTVGTSAAALALLGAGGPTGLLDKPKSPFAKKEPPLKVDETIGDLAYVQSAGEVRVEGVGLVLGLDGTGSDPEPGPYRQKLLSKMRAAMVPQTDRILASKDTSLVLVRASIPVGISKQDVFDVEVELTPASNTTSLAGGVLLKTELTQVAHVKGQELEGKVLSYAGGPIVTGNAAQPDNPKVGRILGGARVREDIPYALLIKENRKSIKTAALLQSVVGARFSYLDGPDKKSAAQAKTDQYLVLRVPQTYHQNQARFFQVLLQLAIIDTPELRAQRLERWTAELLDPKTAGVAALKLEGIGRNASEILKRGLSSTDPDVRFFAAEALAYLNDASGAAVLGEAALSRPEYRAFALAALAASDQAASVTKLRDLMSHPDPEVRCGAFNALSSLDPHDAFLGRQRVLEDEPLTLPEGTDESDAMALQIAAARARRNQPAEPFSLYLVDCDGPPLIHVANSRRCEIVVFGARQKLLTPVVLGDANSVIINAGPEDAQIRLSRITPGGAEPDQQAYAPPGIGAVVKTAANLGATYPQIVSLLQAAERQKNLEGPLVVDALPAPTPAYDQAQLASRAADPKDAKRDEALGRASSERPSTRRGLLERLRPGARGERRPR